MSIGTFDHLQYQQQAACRSCPRETAPVADSSFYTSIEGLFCSCSMDASGILT